MPWRCISGEKAITASVNDQTTGIIASTGMTELARCIWTVHCLPRCKYAGRTYRRAGLGAGEKAVMFR